MLWQLCEMSRDGEISIKRSNAFISPASASSEEFRELRAMINIYYILHIYCYKYYNIILKIFVSVTLHKEKWKCTVDFSRAQVYLQFFRENCSFED